MGRRFFRRQRPVSPDIGIIHSEEPLSYEEEVALHHASQVAHTSSNYRLNAQGSGNNGSTNGGSVATPSGTTSIETILSSNGAMAGETTRRPVNAVRSNGWERMIKRLSVVGKASSGATHVAPTMVASSTNAASTTVEQSSSVTTHLNGHVVASKPSQGIVPDTNNQPKNIAATVPPASSNVTGTSAPPPPFQRPAPVVRSSVQSRSAPTAITTSGVHHLPPIPLPASAMGLPGSTSVGAGPSSSSRRATRDNSMSPTMVATNSTATPNAITSSPPSSMIFERSVQEVVPHTPGDEKIPTHYHDENYIPAVLDASTTAITDSSIDPEMVDVLWLRHGSRSRSLTVSSALSGAASPTSGSTSPERAPRSPVGLGVKVNSPQIAAAISGGTPMGEPRPMLSFCSFADIVNTEQQEQQQQQQQQKDQIAQGTPSPLVTRRPSMGFEMFSRPRASTRGDVGYDDFDDDEGGISITSMGELVRRNTGEITSQIHA